MRKYTRIGLMFLVTLIINLALAIPGLAEDPTIGECHIRFPAHSPGVTLNENMEVPGVLRVMDWYGDKLINVCEGLVPFGESAVGKGKLTFYTYAELESLDFIEWTEGSAYISPDTLEGTAWVFDPDGTAYPATYWELTILPYGGYEFYKEYTSTP